MTKLEELPVPAAVERATQKAELARIWLADGKQFVTISSRIWDDPGTWGLMLVDLAKHVARAYEERGRPKAETLTRIRAAMDAEWGNATDS